MRKYLFCFMATLIVLLSMNSQCTAQQYKLRQVNNMVGMKNETTIYVKGMRKRTEGGGVMSMGIITVEQCDKQRTIKINDKKKLYFIIPFAKDEEEVIDEDAKTAAKTKTISPALKDKTIPQKGGVITIWYNITDTGERKKVYGFTARHVWTYQKIKPSPDACMMKDSMIIKTDGWYIDLPEFNCPVKYRPSQMPQSSPTPQPECKDRFVSRRSGKGKLGFPLSETRTMIMGNSGPQKSEFETSLETLELTAGKLDSMLFEIPLGYKEAASEEELRDKIGLNEMVDLYKNMNKDGAINQAMNNNAQKKPGAIRVGIYEPKSDAQLETPSLQQYIVTTMRDGNVEMVAVSSEEDAKKQECDYTLASNFVKMKQTSKVGGLLKAIKNTDPNAATSYNVDANFTLVKLSGDFSTQQKNVNGKFEGKPEEAAKKALDEGCRAVLKLLK